ncbi:MAG: bifunctional DNA primase/polymerase, partial [Xanthomonadales bacterium]|nr:bifunctional DNA primase/polymerase [Xanthomonadales bacterium]
MKAEVARAAALVLYDQGLTPLPLRYKTKKPILDWKPYIRERPTRDRVINWFNAPPVVFNLGVLCGPTPQGRLVVLDFDCGAASYFQWLTRVSSQVSSTYTVRAIRGYHVYAYVSLDCDIPRLAQGYDLKHSGLVVEPGSLHASGQMYTVWRDEPIVQLADINDLLVDLPRAANKAGGSVSSRGTSRERLPGHGPAWWVKTKLSPLVVLDLFGRIYTLDAQSVWARSRLSISR